jgi:restriction system protein
MAEVTRRRTGELLKKLFEILMAQPDGLPAREALDKLRGSATLSEYENGRYKSGSSRFDQIVRYATIDAAKAGWLSKHKGQWTVTDAGKESFVKYADPEAFYRQAVKLYHQWRRGKSKADSAEPPDSGEGENAESSSITFEEAGEQAWAEVERYLRSMPPYDFQELVAALLRAMGYFVAWVAPPGKDGGIDVLAWSDPLGTKRPRVKVQVKRVGQNVSVDGLRSFMAILSADDVGLFVTTSGFTKDAQDEARKQENRQVTLVDLERFFDLWVEHYSRLDEAARRRFPLQPIYFLAPGV